MRTISAEQAIKLVRRARDPNEAFYDLYMDIAICDHLTVWRTLYPYPTFLGWLSLQWLRVILWGICWYRGYDVTLSVNDNESEKYGED